MNNLKRNSTFALICFVLFSALLLITMRISLTKGLKSSTLKSNSALSRGAGDVSDEANKINNTCSEFIRAVKNEDYAVFKEIVSPSGLIIIKNYTYGDGVRGKDLRNTYHSEDVPKDMRFSITGGSYVSIKEVFEKVLDSDVRNVKHSNLENIYFGFKTLEDKKNVKPSTEEVWAICESIRAAGGKENYPEVYSLSGKEFVFTTSEYNTSRGSWAVFERKNDKYYLRAVMDFR